MRKEYTKTTFSCETDLYPMLYMFCYMFPLISCSHVVLQRGSKNADSNIEPDKITFPHSAEMTLVIMNIILFIVMILIIITDGVLHVYKPSTMIIMSVMNFLYISMSSMCFVYGYYNDTIFFVFSNVYLVFTLLMVIVTHPSFNICRKHVTIDNEEFNIERTPLIV